MEVQACGKCGSIESVRLTIVKKRKGFLGIEVKDAFVTDRCFHCKSLLSGTTIWVDDDSVKENQNRTVRYAS